MKSSHEDENFAPLIDQVEEKKEKLDQMDPGAFDYSLKCINRSFKDKFVFLNLGPEGEIIGSGNTPDVSLTIEDPSVEEKHAKIFFNTEYQYILNDLSKEAGTWVCLQNVVSLKNIFCYGKDVPIILHIKKHTIELSKKKLYNIQLSEWLSRHKLSEFKKILYDMNINSMLDLNYKKRVIIEDEKLEPIANVIDDAKKHKKSMLNVLFDNASVSIEVRNDEPVLIGSGSKCQCRMTDENVLDVHLKIFKDKNEFKIEVVRGKDSKRKFPRVWRKLHPTENYFVYPEDLIRVGKIVLLVQRFNVGIFADIGSRPLMEDFNQAIHDLRISDSIHCSFYGVYDGHQGEYCAKYIREHLPWIFKKIAAEKLNETDQINTVMHESLKAAFLEVDAEFHINMKDNSSYSGQGSSNKIFIKKRESIIWLK